MSTSEYPALFSESFPGGLDGLRSLCERPVDRLLGQPMRSWTLKIVDSAAATLPAAFVVSFPVPASADHVYGTYPSRGYIWMARTTTAGIWLASTSCNPRELGAYDRVKASTTFPNKWPNGIDMHRQNCDGSVNNTTDIKLSYEPASNFIQADGTPYGGWNEHKAATSAWCAYWGVAYPCGTHAAVVHLNQARFGSSNYSHEYRERLIMHETGHSLGLAHHCSSDSIMNDGTSGCHGGRWTQVMSYQVTDKDGIRNVYPNWMYP
ncbi:MAG: hypothetical protein QM595_11390 [Nocardioides sp.]